MAVLLGLPADDQKPPVHCLWWNGHGSRPKQKDPQIVRNYQRAEKRGNLNNPIGPKKPPRRDLKASRTNKLGMVIGKPPDEEQIGLQDLLRSFPRGTQGRQLPQKDSKREEAEERERSKTK